MCLRLHFPQIVSLNEIDAKYSKHKVSFSMANFIKWTDTLINVGCYQGIQST